MFARIKPHYWWPNMKAEIENYANSCKRCGATLAQGHRNAPIHQRPREMEQFALIEVDLKGPLPRTKEGYNNIVVIADPTTKYAEMHPIRGQTSEVVCGALKGWISRYGLPKKLHSDNGPCFTSTRFQQFCAGQGIKHTLSPPYRPQANAGVERINRTMGEALTKLVNQHPKKWSEHLPDVQLAYNSAEHASIGTSPYELVYKEHPRSKFEMLTEKISPATMEEKNNRIKSEAAQLFRQAVESDLKAAEKRRKQYNKKCSFKPFSIGSQVWKRNVRAKTFADRWVGPYVIVRPTTMTWTTYVIRLESGRKEETVHYNYLKTYHVRSEQVQQPKKKRERRKPKAVNISSGTSDESEIEIENNNDRRYPERRRRPPERYTCN